MLTPFPAGEAPAASDVCLLAAQMLDAVQVEVFELALWKTWAHREGSDAVDEGPVE